MKEGIEKGQVCNRNGCNGTIAEYEKEGGCSCHVSPPCSFCTEDNSYCPLCEWYANEIIVQESKIKSIGGTLFEDPFRSMRLIKGKMESGTGIDKLEWFNTSHTNSTMVKTGVYPKGMAKEELVKKIKGTFGGRFVYLTDHSFKYIAYTD